MPWETTWEPHGIVWRFHGHVTAAEIEAANGAFYRDPRSDDARYQIIDALGVTSLDWPELEVRKAAAYDLGANRTLRRLKVAWVATNEDVESGMERYADLGRRLGSVWAFRGFRDLDSAKAWVESEGPGSA